jgi:ADP-ribose pyrophosphatase YjhB (NUDIX family)
MKELQRIDYLMQTAEDLFVASLSVDCVIFGFHLNQLKVLLLKVKKSDEWALPGGFVYKAEHIEQAAVRVLKERTGLDDIFLSQFHAFGDPKRSDLRLTTKRLQNLGVKPNHARFLMQRFVTIGFYALVDFLSVSPTSDSLSEACAWWDLHCLPKLILDHEPIIQKALAVMRSQLNHQPIGYNLLPLKFTMPELQKLYETLLDISLDRRNFQRRILGYGIIRKLKERRKGGAHKAPFLYSFDKRKYHKALKEGFQERW